MDTQNDIFFALTYLPAVAENLLKNVVERFKFLFHGKCRFIINICKIAVENPYIIVGELNLKVVVVVG